MRERHQFTTTRWSVVLRARGDDPEQTRAALEQLCREYWYPLYVYVRRSGKTPEDAADLTQSFFAKLLESDFLEGLSVEGGKFRSFLLRSLNRFLVSEWRKGQRLKRGGGVVVTSIERMILDRGEASYLGELAHQETPEHLYQRAWAETLLQSVLQRLEREYAERGERGLSVLRRFLTQGEDSPTLARAAEDLGMTLAAFKSLLHRYRTRYRELLLTEVAETVGSKAEAAEELRELLGALRR